MVFLPGTKEITRARLLVAAGRTVAEEVVVWDWCWTLRVLPLPAPCLPTTSVRLRDLPGSVKVVLSTNVAETSITIDDVVCVVDTGRVKEERYDGERLMSSLEDVMVSKAAAKQRRGRAGRVRPGIAFHLFTSDASMAQYTDPEVRRVGLQQLVMRVKALNLPGNAEAGVLVSRPPVRRRCTTPLKICDA